jgi:undecaprenyl-diphosphatase
MLHWMRARFADKPNGLILTLGLAGAAVLTTLFIKIAKNVLLKEEIVDIDAYIMQLVYGWRTDWLTEFFKFMTFLGGIEGVALFMLALLILGWKHRILPLAFGAALTLAVFVTQSLKVVFGRLRPEEAFRLVVENGFSFPSGHTFMATILFGLSGYLLARAVLSGWRYAAAAGAAALIGLVGASRVYLGVHFPSDVLASMTFASAFLCLFIALIEINQRYELRKKYMLKPAMARPLLVSFAITAAAGLVYAWM